MAILLLFIYFLYADFFWFKSLLSTLLSVFFCFFLVFSFFFFARRIFSFYSAFYFFLFYSKIKWNVSMNLNLFCLMNTYCWYEFYFELTLAKAKRKRHLHRSQEKKKTESEKAIKEKNGILHGGYEFFGSLKTVKMKKWLVETRFFKTSQKERKKFEII